MIRQFRRSAPRLVIVAVVGIVAAGAPALAASAFGMGHGGPVENVHQSKPGVLVLTPRQIEYLRQQVLELKLGKYWTNEKIARLWVSLDILTAPTQAERHRLVRRLPVTVFTWKTTVNGRTGTMKAYAAGGKVRTQTFVPDRHRAPDAENSSGPSADGDVQEPLCYDDAGWDECATDQEIEDADYLDAYAMAVTEAGQAEYDYWAYHCACAVPDAMASDISHSVTSEPCAADSANDPRECAGKAIEATGSLVGTILAHEQYLADKGKALAYGTKLTKSAATRSGAAFVAGAFLVGWTVGSFVGCVVPYFQEPASEPVLLPERRLHS